MSRKAWKERSFILYQKKIVGQSRLCDSVYTSMSIMICAVCLWVWCYEAKYHWGLFPDLEERPYDRKSVNQRSIPLIIYQPIREQFLRMVLRVRR